MGISSNINYGNGGNQSLPPSFKQPPNDRNYNGGIGIIEPPEDLSSNEEQNLVKSVDNLPDEPFNDIENVVFNSKRNRGRNEILSLPENIRLKYKIGAFELIENSLKEDNLDRVDKAPIKDCLTFICNSDPKFESQTLIFKGIEITETEILIRKKYNQCLAISKGDNSNQEIEDKESEIIANNHTTEIPADYASSLTNDDLDELFGIKSIPEDFHLETQDYDKFFSTVDYNKFLESLSNNPQERQQVLEAIQIGALDRLAFIREKLGHPDRQSAILQNLKNELPFIRFVLNGNVNPQEQEIEFNESTNLQMINYYLNGIPKFNKLEAEDKQQLIRDVEYFLNYEARNEKEDDTDDTLNLDIWHEINFIVTRRFQEFEQKAQEALDRIIQTSSRRIELAQNEMYNPNQNYIYVPPVGNKLYKRLDVKVI